MINSVILKPGREKSLLRCHPWIFSGAIARIEGSPRPGETIFILSSEGDILARGAYSPHSQIAVRIWSFNPDEDISPAFFRNRLQAAINVRSSMIKHSDTAFRLVNAESDRLPGVIIDRYADFLVCQFLSAGAEYWKKHIARQLEELISCAGIYERSDADVRKKEGLAPCTGILAGNEPPELIEIEEAPLRFLVDIRNGHKTGFYLDQRDNRAAIDEYAAGTEMLNCFAYTGGFGIRALKYGAAKIINAESSAPAVDICNRNIQRNGLDSEKVENIEGDVFHVLRGYRDSRREFDLIVLDPPKFAESRSQLQRAARGYKDINLLGFKLLRPGGILFTFSCSGLMAPELFQKIVADAALDAKRDAQILRRLGQAPDHPTALNFPEGNYLKGLICRAF
jgi:23S rRNA (cytosine1962-C5)-methyltransferase